MSGISISQGSRIFFSALKQDRWWSLCAAAEWMYRLNVFARSNGRHPINEQIYDLKNVLIKYLYQHGYCVEVKQHIQKKECWRCEGTGEYWTGDECWKCRGTGVFSKVELYAFRFNIEGKRYAWHQPKRLVDYPVTLTEIEPGAFVEPARDAAILKLQDAWLGCCAVWWCLMVRGCFTHLILLDAVRNRLKAAVGITAAQRWLVRNRANFIFWWTYEWPWGKQRMHSFDEIEQESIGYDVSSLGLEDDDSPF